MVPVHPGPVHPVSLLFRGVVPVVQPAKGLKENPQVAFVVGIHSVLIRLELQNPLAGL